MRNCVLTDVFEGRIMRTGERQVGVTPKVTTVAGDVIGVQVRRHEERVNELVHSRINQRVLAPCCGVFGVGRAEIDVPHQRALPQIIPVGFVAAAGHRVCTCCWAT